MLRLLRSFRLHWSPSSCAFLLWCLGDGHEYSCRRQKWAGSSCSHVFHMLRGIWILNHWGYRIVQDMLRCFECCGLISHNCLHIYKHFLLAPLCFSAGLTGWSNFLLMRNDHSAQQTCGHSILLPCHVSTEIMWLSIQVGLPAGLQSQQLLLLAFYLKCLYTHAVLVGRQMSRWSYWVVSIIECYTHIF